MTHVRPYALSDKQACLAIFDSNVPDFFDSTERPDFAGFLDGPDGEYFIVEQEGAVIGCGGFAKEDRGQARFTWGMVSNRHHGEGLGRLLAEYRLRAMDDAGDYAEVELFTTPIVAPFFEKLGFAIAQVDKDGFAPGMDKVQMIKTLT
ncbi:GNAT family N-acetyltransferase [Parasphingorhabdus sp.]|uniref:GNAT family N-acetyltransferase n=1 Tax=Parasphingorhabdus sp. TaxID=2709688 RepID=UPI003264EFAC